MIISNKVTCFVTEKLLGFELISNQNKENNKNTSSYHYLVMIDMRTLRMHKIGENHHCYNEKNSNVYCITDHNNKNGNIVYVNEQIASKIKNLVHQCLTNSTNYLTIEITE